MFTRGGSLEGGGPVNPTSASSGPTAKHVYVQPLAGGAPRDLGPGDSPAPSPAKDQIAFVRDGQIGLDALGQTRQLKYDAGTADKVAWCAERPKAGVRQPPQGPRPLRTLRSSAGSHSVDVAERRHRCGTSLVSRWAKDRLDQDNLAGPDFRGLRNASRGAALCPFALEIQQQVRAT